MKNSNPAEPPNNIIAITMGCPVGIGPEIILRFVAGQEKLDYLPVVLGDAGVLKRCAAELKIPAKIEVWQPGEKVQPGAVNVLPLSELGADLAWGKPDRDTGRAMASYIEKAVELVDEGHVAAMTTCPISKSALHAAGYDFPGHTEMLASLCHAEDYAMMMAGASLRVTLVTIHRRLADVPAGVTREAVTRLIQITGEALRRDFGISEPRIAVAALNPHAGEDGLFGDEEQREILPAINDVREKGLQVSGPLPPDTVFHKAVAGHFDAVVCMYHDQGLIPFKLLHFSDGVNVTIGLPIVRTSVDHGTAYDIAGKGFADPASLRAAFIMAGNIISNRRQFQHL